MGECATGLEAVTHMREQEPDLLFLDIQMPGMTGFEALAQVEFQRIPAIIFVTAFDQYAVKAFEVHALDYLMKPFTDQRFNEALQKAKSSIELKEINRLSPKSPGFARQSRGDRTHRHQTLSQTVHDSIRRTRLFH
jgi:two-component system LytT family response regulator